MVKLRNGGQWRSQKSDLIRSLASLKRFPAIVRIIAFLLILGLCWAPFALPILLLVKDANLQSLLTMPILYFLFVGLLQIWNPAVHSENQPLKRYGLHSLNLNFKNLFSGLLVAWGFVLILFFFQGDMGWMQWFNPSPGLSKIVLESLVVSLAVGFAEELLFRGWLLDELDRDYSKRTATIACSAIFASSFLFIFTPVCLPINWKKQAGIKILHFITGIHESHRQFYLQLPSTSNCCYTCFYLFLSFKITSTQS